MHRKTLITILGIVAVIFIGTGVYSVSAKKARQVKGVTAVTSESTALKTYTNEQYGFSFQYPTDLVPISTSNDSAVVLAGENGDHWAYSISAENNSGHRSLDSLFGEMLNDTLMWRSNDDYIKVVSNIILGGMPAKRYSITNYGDYGNAGAMVLFGNTIVAITGDDSTHENKKYFDVLLSTFTFGIKTPIATMKIQQCPDAWIDDQMPFIGKERRVTEYFIVHGEHRDINAFDVEWIEKNCTLTKQVVY